MQMEKAKKGINDRDNKIDTLKTDIVKFKKII